jgi:hypothetical protein
MTISTMDGSRTSTTARLLDFVHLDRMTDDRALFEHAKGTAARREHGYCTDDNARLLIAVSRATPTKVITRLGRVALGFVLEAQDHDGRSRNRMDVSGRWTDEAGVEDCWGRSLWSLGVVASTHPDPSARRRAGRGFNHGATNRSPHLRAMTFAALGAGELLGRHRDHDSARRLAADFLAMIGPTLSASWVWPEPTLRYANAAVAEAMILCASALDRPADLERGLAMLRWLLDYETIDGHLSVVGVGGGGPETTKPQFDQQPIEVAALVDACWRAAEVTGDVSWWEGVELGAQWFLGRNDAGLVMIDPDSGGGFDGLSASSVNTNQGAESTLAALSTMQRSALRPR